MHQRQISNNMEVVLGASSSHNLLRAYVKLSTLQCGATSVVCGDVTQAIKSFER